MKINIPIDNLIEQIVHSIIDTGIKPNIMKFAIDILSCYQPYEVDKITSCCICSICIGCSKCFTDFFNHIKNCWYPINKQLFLYAIYSQYDSYQDILHPYILHTCSKQDHKYLDLITFINSNSNSNSNPNSTNISTIEILSLASTLIQDPQYTYIIDTIRHNPNTDLHHILCHLQIENTFLFQLGYSYYSDHRSITFLYNIINDTSETPLSLRSLIKILRQNTYIILCKIINIDP